MSVWCAPVCGLIQRHRHTKLTSPLTSYVYSPVEGTYIYTHQAVYLYNKCMLCYRKVFSFSSMGKVSRMLTKECMCLPLVKHCSCSYFHNVGHMVVGVGL